MERIELIRLALFEIGRECDIIDSVAVECRHMRTMGKDKDPIFERIEKRHEMLLAGVHEKLRDIMEEVGEYMNNYDIVSGVDVAINKTIYDLVYERTSELDYEKHQTNDFEPLENSAL